MKKKILFLLSCVILFTNAANTQGQTDNDIIELQKIIITPNRFSQQF